MDDKHCKALTLICLGLAAFALIEHILVVLMNEHLYNGPNTKTTIDIFRGITSWQWVGGNNDTSVAMEIKVVIRVIDNTSNVTKETIDSSHHYNLIPGIRFDDHKLFLPFVRHPQPLTSAADLHTNEYYDIFDILKRWSNLTLPFLDKTTPILHLPALPSRPFYPRYCVRDKALKRWLVECQDIKSRDLSPWEQSGNHIMFTLRTTTSFHSSRIPLLFQTWMTTVNRSNIFIVTDSHEVILESRAKEAGKSKTITIEYTVHVHVRLETRCLDRPLASPWAQIVRLSGQTCFC